MIRASLVALLGLHAFGCYHGAQLADLLRPRVETGAPPLYAERCASCHGDAGRGDGLAGRSLDPTPRDFADPAWQTATADARIRTVIRRGGGAAGLSASMAPHADLSDEELDTLLAYIRHVGETAEISSARAARTGRPR